LKLLVDGAGETAIFEQLSQEYQLTRAEFDRYFLDFITVLKSSQLLENDA
jgi:hypothetical protein